MQGRTTVSTTLYSVFLALMVAVPAQAQNVAVVENFDSDVDGWVFSAAPHVEMVWDDLEGSPLPGSLRISFVEPPPEFIAHLAFSRCMEASPGELWWIEAMLRKTGTLNGKCVAFITQFEGPGCTGERSTIGNVPFINPDVWIRSIGGTQIWATTHSVRVALGLNVFPGIGESHCHFDSIVVTNDRLPPVTDVPGLSSTGMAVLAVVTGLAGLFFLRRRLGRVPCERRSSGF